MKWHAQLIEYKTFRRQPQNAKSPVILSSLSYYKLLLFTSKRRLQKHLIFDFAIQKVV